MNPRMKRARQIMESEGHTSQVFRGLKKLDTPIIDRMNVYYNYTRPHGSLKVRTPDEAPMIEVDGKNRCLTLI